MKRAVGAHLVLCTFLMTTGCEEKQPEAHGSSTTAQKAQPKPVESNPTPPASAVKVAAAAEKPSDVPKNSARPAEWGYEGKESPAHWAELSPAYAACGKGEKQSPIDIPVGASGTKQAWKLEYGTTALKIAHHEHVHDIIDNGHTIQVTVDEGNTLTTDEDRYELKQFHFHTPSENTVDGKHFPMEAHFVHQSEKGNFAVVALFFSEGAADENLEKLVTHLPKSKGEKVEEPEVELELELHLPKDRKAYHFVGSFTTPPCTEHVEWLVFEQPVPASAEQLKAFAQRLDHNNRPVQALQDREIALGEIGK